MEGTRPPLRDWRLFEICRARDFSSRGRNHHGRKPDAGRNDEDTPRVNSALRSSTHKVPSPVTDAYAFRSENPDCPEKQTTDQMRRTIPNRVLAPEFLLNFLKRF